MDITKVMFKIGDKMIMKGVNGKEVEGIITSTNATAVIGGREVSRLVEVEVDE